MFMFILLLNYLFFQVLIRISGDGNIYGGNSFLLSIFLFLFDDKIFITRKPFKTLLILINMKSSKHFGYN